ncbi:MAG: thioredoxin family protein [Elusimicrobia bacterium]|nr:thioredoxin family protein [Elusimicrobiota bacterium]
MPAQIGERAANFSLPGIDGKNYELSALVQKGPVAVVFSCNHCPYVQAYEQRMIDLQAAFGSKGFQIAAINANDAQTYPEDSFDAMKKRAKGKNFNFLYLRDESQAAAQAYGAVRTPHVFLVDQRQIVRYIGAIDDNWENPSSVKKRYLAQAIEHVLAGQEPAVNETFPVGCTIKWKK